MGDCQTPRGAFSYSCNIFCPTTDFKPAFLTILDPFYTFLTMHIGKGYIFGSCWVRLSRPETLRGWRVGPRHPSESASDQLCYYLVIIGCVCVKYKAAKVNQLPFIQ